MQKYYATLRDKNGDLRVVSPVNAYLEDPDSRVLLYLELQSRSVQVINAFWANIRRNWRTQSITRTYITIIDYDNNKYGVFVRPKTKYHYGSQGDHYFVLHEGFDKMHRLFLIGGTKTEPSLYFLRALQKNIEIPFLKSWVSSLWKEAVEQELVKPMPGLGCTGWKLVKDKQEAWQDMLLDLRAEGLLLAPGENPGKKPRPKRKTKAEPFQLAVEEILKAHGRLDKFNKEKSFYLKLDPERTSIMPLVIEKLPFMTPLNGPGVSVSHFYMQNGDVMRDPELVFDEDWHVRMYQQDNLGVYQVYANGDFTDKEFLQTWAKNLLEQGFKEAKII